MDELLRYASLAAAGLPAHERHKAKASTVRQLRRVHVDSDGVPRFAAPLACNERSHPAKLAGLTFSIRDERGSSQVVLRAADNDDRAQANPTTDTTPPPTRRTRKLILLAY
jgi:hypothetical protein